METSYGLSADDISTTELATRKLPHSTPPAKRAGKILLQRCRSDLEQKGEHLGSP